MRQRVVHWIKTDTDLIGGIVTMWCGLRFIREEDPTDKEGEEILKASEGRPDCKKCLRAKNKEKVPTDSGVISSLCP